MIKEEYKNGCRLKEQVKYNIDYDDCQILNLTCANYIYDLVQESSKYETKLEDVKKMLYMIEKLLGHEVQYDIPEYHGDNKKCYFGVVSDNFVINEDNIKQLDYVLQDTKEFVKSFSTDYQKILYCYPNVLTLPNTLIGTKTYDKFGNELTWSKSDWLNPDGSLVTKVIFASKLNDFTKNNTIYNIVRYIDLKGETITIPENSVLNFIGGAIGNGTIIGNKTKVINLNVDRIVLSGTWFDSGTTSNRPTNVLVGFQYFDTTINKPIFWDGSKWIDATGATV